MVRCFVIVVCSGVLVLGICVACDLFGSRVCTCVFLHITFCWRASASLTSAMRSCMWPMTGAEECQFVERWTRKCRTVSCYFIQKTLAVSIPIYMYYADCRFWRFADKHTDDINVNLASVYTRDCAANTIYVWMFGAVTVDTANVFYTKSYGFLINISLSDCFSLIVEYKWKFANYWNRGMFLFHVKHVYQRKSTLCYAMLGVIE